MSKRQSKPTGRKVHTQRANTLVSAPVAIGAGLANVGASLSGRGNSITISHREFFSSLTSEGVNPNQASYWTIQPGWSSMFPWLSQIAQNYEVYAFDELVFEYHPRLPTTTTGTVVLVIDPDPDDDPIEPDEVGRQQLLAHLGAHENPIWSETKCVLRASALRQLGSRYVRTGSSSTIEPRTTDLGRFYAATYGTVSAGNTVIFGDLWVSYRVHLSVPQLTIDPSGVNKKQRILSSSSKGGIWTVGSIPQNVWYTIGQFQDTPARTYSSKSLSDTISLIPQFTEALNGFMAYKNSLLDDGITSATFTGAVVCQFVIRNPSSIAPPLGLSIKASLYYDGVFYNQLRSVDLTVTGDPLDGHNYVYSFTFQGEIPSLDQNYTWKLEMQTSSAGHYQFGNMTHFYVGDFTFFRNLDLGRRLRNLNLNGRSYLPGNVAALLRELSHDVWKETPDLVLKPHSSCRSGLVERPQPAPPVSYR